MKVGFGCDHVAIELKNILMEHLKEKGYECESKLSGTRS